MDGVAVGAAVATYPKMFSAQDKGRYALITLTLINLLNYIDRCQTNTAAALHTRTRTGSALWTRPCIRMMRHRAGH